MFPISSVLMDDNDSTAFTIIERDGCQASKKNAALSHSHFLTDLLVPAVGFSMDSSISESKYKTKDGLSSSDSVRISPALLAQYSRESQGTGT